MLAPLTKKADTVHHKILIGSYLAASFATQALSMGLVHQGLMHLLVKYPLLTLLGFPHPLHHLLLHYCWQTKAGAHFDFAIGAM